jgi:hypothetical protein
MWIGQWVHRDTATVMAANFRDCSRSDFLKERERLVEGEVVVRHWRAGSGRGAGPYQGRAQHTGRRKETPFVVVFCVEKLRAE